MSDFEITVPAVENPTAVNELVKFLQLSHELKQPLTMFSGYIDDAWHSLLQDPASYADLCANSIGAHIGHIPSGDSRRLVEVEWLGQYESRHGKLPKEWFSDEAGLVNWGLYQRYLATGVIVDSWKCTPQRGSTGGAE